MAYSKQTYCYKTVQGCQLQADVYCLAGSKPRPGILWIHGGGLIFGNRGMIPHEQIELYMKAGYILISIDYRLAPETKLAGIVEDVQGAYEWVKSRGPELFGVDPERLAVIGHSAGGYLALMVGGRVSSRPKAIVSFYGYGDLASKWCYCCDADHTKHFLVPRETAYQGVGGAVIAGSQFTGLSDKRWLFYLFCRQQGLWLKEISGIDFMTEPELLKPFCPVRTITSDYPPTLLLHGDQDGDVPVASSIQVANVLAQNQVPYQLLILEGFGHIFDIASSAVHERAPTGLKNAKVFEAFMAVQAFLNERLLSQSPTSPFHP